MHNNENVQNIFSSYTNEMRTINRQSRKEEVNDYDNQKEDL